MERLKKPISWETAYKTRRCNMRTMRIALMVCLAIATMMLFGQSVWAGAEVTEFTWYWCGPNQSVIAGTQWTSGSADDQGVQHTRGAEFYDPLCDATANPSVNCCKDPARIPAGYLFLMSNVNWGPKLDPTKDRPGVQWGDFLISSGLKGTCPGPFCEPDGILWEGTFTGNGDGYYYRYQKLVGSGVGDNAGMQLRALAETIDRSKPPNKNDHVINGTILNPGSQY
jgi:hypothetical protein